MSEEENQSMEDFVQEPLAPEESAGTAAATKCEDDTEEACADSAGGTVVPEEETSDFGITTRPKKRSRTTPPTSRGATPVPSSDQAVSAAAAAAAAQAALANGLTGLYTLLTASMSSSSSSSSSTTSSSSFSMPSVEQVRQAATRAINDAPPYVHLSVRDSAPQLKLEDGPSGRRLLLRGGMRGYRMARASHGVTEGNYYYEVLVLPPPPIQEIIDSLPRNVRLGKNLKKQLQEQLEQQQRQQSKTSDADAPTSSKDKDGVATAASTKTKAPAGGRKRKRADGEAAASSAPPQQTIGGNVRIGWSMRTGDLQAPVGYDKWSYGLRDIAGSRIHNSRREDSWGGEPFGPGDVVGFAICMSSSSSSSSSAKTTAAAESKKGSTTNHNNHIRFFKNGEAMGHFVVSRGKREGGAAFDNIPDGTYYPAISTYLGGTVKVNFGPHFRFPPRSLPSGLKLRPVSEICKAPPTPEEAVANATKERIFKKTDEALVTAFRDAIQTEAQMRYDAYEEHVKRHLEEIKAFREGRNLSTSDLV